jgi:hypothetical protein
MGKSAYITFGLGLGSYALFPIAIELQGLRWDKRGCSGQGLHIINATSFEIVFV